MILRNLSLQNFRSYTKASFDFSDTTTIIIGPNGIGKSNLIEAVFLLATGKSFRAEKEVQLISFGKKTLRVEGEIEEEKKLEIVFVDQETGFLKKKYLVNGVSKRRADFAGHIAAVLFTPADLDLVSGQPSNRRRFLDEVLEQVDVDYRIAHATYTKALRQRNALLSLAQETGRRNEKQFEYWDELLIRTGNVITEKREELIKVINEQKKDFFDCILFYDKSTISTQRLEQYEAAEIGAGVTLVGPHRDDILFKISGEKDARYFASRGQQRLIVLEMKIFEINFMKEKTGKNPILFLDDIFSELDDKNIGKILGIMNHHQAIITTTHKEFVENASLKEVKMIELK